MDADIPLIEDWYVTRFMRLRQTAFRDPAAYFHRYAHLSPDEARAKALEIWRTINAKNPTRTSCPPGSAPASSCARAPTTRSRAWRCGGFEGVISAQAGRWAREDTQWPIR